MRMNNNFKSSVMNSAEVDEGSSNAAPRSAVQRKNAKWESTVFGGPTETIPGRRCLAKEGAGKGGLFGD